jgi:hypothetical protein
VARSNAARPAVRRHYMTDLSGPLFSVLLLAGGEKDLHLRGAMRSVWAQAAGDLEIIVIDCSASHRDHQLIERLLPESAVPASVVRAGTAIWPTALNAGAEAATGRYLAFLDPNDEYHPDRLDAFRRAHRICGGFVWGFSGVEMIDPRDRPVAVEMIPDSTLRSAVYASLRPAEAIRNLPLMFTPVSWGNLVVDAGMFRELGCFRGYQHLWDWDLALRMFRTSDPVTIERPLYRHRVRDREASAPDAPALRLHVVAQEQTAITEDFWRGMVHDGLGDRPLIESRIDAPGWPTDPDTRAAIAAAEWGIDQLRRIPVFYAAVRRSALIVRRASRRLR